MPKQVNYKNINVTGTTTGTIAFLTSLDISEYYVYGSSVLTGNLDLSAGGSEIDGMVIEIYYYASITPGAFNLSILGTVMPDHLCAIPQRIFAVYQSGWKVSFMPSFNQNSIIETFNIKDGAVQYGKILDNSVTIYKLYDPGDGYMIRFTGSGGSYISPGSAGNILSWAGGTPQWLPLTGDISVAEGGSVTLSPTAVTLQKAHDGGYSITTADGATSSPVVFTNNTTGGNPMCVYNFNNVGGYAFTYTDSNTTGYFEVINATKKRADGNYKALTISVDNLTTYTVYSTVLTISNGQTGSGFERIHYNEINTNATGCVSGNTMYIHYDKIGTYNSNDNKYISSYTLFTGNYNPASQQKLIGGMVEFQTTTINGYAELIGYKVEMVDSSVSSGIVKGFEVTNYDSPATYFTGTSIRGFRCHYDYALNVAYSGANFVGLELATTTKAASSNNAREYQIYSTMNTVNGDDVSAIKYGYWQSHSFVSGSAASVYSNYMLLTGTFNGAATQCAYLIDYNAFTVNNGSANVYGMYIDLTSYTHSSGVNSNAIHIEEASTYGMLKGIYMKKYTGKGMHIDNYSDTYAIDITPYGTAIKASINIDGSVNVADNMYGIRIDLTNAHLVGDCYAFEFDGDLVVTGTASGTAKILKVYYNSAPYYINLYPTLT